MTSLHLRDARPLLLLAIGGALFSMLTGGAAPEPPIRPLARPLPHHPGNIFIEGEEVIIPLPAGSTNLWRLFD